jgi:hypothetical protein
MARNAASVSARFSKSLARRRLRPNHEKVRSTTHRRGRTSKPFMSSLRLTISRPSRVAWQRRHRPARLCKRCRPRSFRASESGGVSCREPARLRRGPGSRRSGRRRDALVDTEGLPMPRRKAVTRQVTPGAAGSQQIDNGVHRRLHVGLARPTTGLRRRDQRFEPRPFLKFLDEPGGGVTGRDASACPVLVRAKIL